MSEGLVVDLPGKIYLGDSVYCEIYRSGGYVLTTENGLPTDPSNTIMLEPEVYRALVLYVTTAQAAIAKAQEEAERRKTK